MTSKEKNKEGYIENISNFITYVIPNIMKIIFIKLI